MQELIIARGIQASGKTTAANLWVSSGENRAAVSRDDIRFSLFGKYWDVDEKAVTKVEDATISSLLRNGYSVFVHDTNMESRFVMRLALLGIRRGIKVEIHDFDISLDEALRRNSLRDRKVPEDVIRKAHSRWTNRKPFELPPIFEPYVWPDNANMMSKTVIFDIDGTLAKMTGRSPYDYSLVYTDSVISQVADVLYRFINGNVRAKEYGAQPWDIILLSGRKSECREQTIKWITDKLNMHPHEYDLYMRADGDERPDSIVKYELFDKNLRNRNIWGVFDDRASVVEMWRGLGLRVFAVDEGDF